MSTATAIKRIKIAFVGGGSQTWAPNIIRDIIFKDGMERVHIDLSLIDLSMERANAVKALFDSRSKVWGIDRVTVSATSEAAKGLKDADFVIIAISTGRLEAMKYDIELPEKYGIYHTVGDSSGPGGWARTLRNIPVFIDYAKKIKKYAPNAFVLNYTNPLGALTAVLTRELGMRKVVGLCHGLFSTYRLLMDIFGLTDEKQMKVRFGGINHFFWILDFTVNGQDGYKLLREKLNGRTLATFVEEEKIEAGKRIDLLSEFFENYGHLTYSADRHTCEHVGPYITDKALMERFRLHRTTIVEREAGYAERAATIAKWTQGEEGSEPFSTTPSRETAADIIKAITFDEGFVDIVNMVNVGQICNLPMGAVVETPGYVDAGGFVPLTIGEMPEKLRAICAPQADVQLRTVEAALAEDREDAILALSIDPICSHMTMSDIRKMATELLDAHRQYLPDKFFM